MMLPSLTSCRRFAAAMLLACSASFAAHAQQTPITGQMLAPTASPRAPEAGSAAPSSTQTAVPAQPVASETADARAQVGDVTHQLVSMQAQGTHAGKHLSIPGPEASASYQRYLKSFEHPIPEFYETAVSKDGGASSGSSSSP